MMYKLFVVLALVCAMVIPVVAAEKDNTCVPCSKAAHLQLENDQDADSGERVMSTSQEGQEWQCIVVDIILECVDYDRVPCASCYVPCIAGCALVCEAGTCWKWPKLCKYAAAPCAVACDLACKASCPKCDECIKYKATKIYSCGWVWTE